MLTFIQISFQGQAYDVAVLTPLYSFTVVNKPSALSINCSGFETEYCFFKESTKVLSSNGYSMSSGFFLSSWTDASSCDRKKRR